MTHRSNGSYDDSELSLYYFPECPYCQRVLDAMKTLGVEFDLRNIRAEQRHLDELMAARGQRTVPVLRIDHADGTSEWMPESADIVAYLRKRFQ